MEIIKKKICIENFISRIPSLIETIDVEGVTEASSDGSWGKIPKMLSILGKMMRYGTIMNLYNSLIKIIVKAKVLEYDELGKKWIKVDYDWRDIIKNHHTRTVQFVTSKPTKNLTDKMLISLVSFDEATFFYQHIQDIFGGFNNGFNFIDEVHSIMGKCVTPSNCTGTYVPYFVYHMDVPDIISFMLDLKSKEDCCNKERYLEYGGDEFLTFLQNLTPPVDNRIYEITTLDIPVLLTTDYKDLGQYKSYDVEEIIEYGNTSQIEDENIDLREEYCEFCGKLLIEDNHDNCKPKMVLTSGESKLRTLRKRKLSVDDYAQTLPGIYIPGQRQLEMPYQEGYVKNIKIDNGVFYGDVIESMVETFTAREGTSGEYNAIISKTWKETHGVNYGTTDKPINGIEVNTVSTTVTYGGSGKTYNQVLNFMNSDIKLRINDIITTMCNILKSEYPNYYCYKQDYEISYELTYTEEDSEGNAVTKIYSAPFSGTLYVVFDNPKIEITYALGAKLRQEGDKLILDEANPFTVSDAELDLWEGDGIWYFETYPLKKLCAENFTINNNEMQLIYDTIDFASMEQTYTFDNIDFPRKNYILCNNIRYRSESYHQSCTYNPVFRDEKMLGVSSSIKEKYDVVIDRGASAAFEKHLQLSEIKTWADLENYRNGMFLNK